MNSWDVRKARIETIRVIVRELDWLEEAQIAALIIAVADERYTQARAKESFIREAVGVIL